MRDMPHAHPVYIPASGDVLISRAARPPCLPQPRRPEVLRATASAAARPPGRTARIFRFLPPTDRIAHG